MLVIRDVYNKITHFEYNPEMSIREIKNEYIMLKMLDIESSDCYILLGCKVLSDDDKIGEHPYFEYGLLTIILRRPLV